MEPLFLSFVGAQLDEPATSSYLPATFAIDGGLSNHPSFKIAPLWGGHCSLVIMTAPFEGIDTFTRPVSVT